MSPRRDYTIPIPQAEVDQMEQMERSWYEQVQDLARQAAKRFWTLELDQNSGWYRLLDPLGREVHPVAPLTQLRGFFAKQPFQA